MASSSHVGATKRDNSLLYFAITVGSLVAFWRLQRRKNEQVESSSTKSEQRDQEALDSFYLAVAHDLRLSLEPPLQSNFRVVALLLLEGGLVVSGTNDEPSPNISLSMCAERCAFLQYRVQQLSRQVKAVYIVTDAGIPIAPGTACREYMFGHPATSPETRIVMQSREPKSESLCLSLGELHPYASIYSGLSPEEQMDLGQKLQPAIRLQLEQLHVLDLTRAELLELVQAAQNACTQDVRDTLHAVRYGAAIALETIDIRLGIPKVEILQAPQIKALEYSSTLDAVSQLASQVLARMRSPHTPRVLAVLLVDQFGIPHGMFAQARAFFVEHGFGDCQVILTTMTTASHVEGTGNDDDRLAKVCVRCVPARDLAPLVPEFRS